MTPDERSKFMAEAKTATAALVSLYSEIKAKLNDDDFVKLFLDLNDHLGDFPASGCKYLLEHRPDLLQDFYSVKTTIPIRAGVSKDAQAKDRELIVKSKLGSLTPFRGGGLDKRTEHAVFELSNLFWELDVIAGDSLMSDIVLDRFLGEEVFNNFEELFDQDDERCDLIKRIRQVCGARKERNDSPYPGSGDSDSELLNVSIEYFSKYPHDADYRYADLHRRTAEVAGEIRDRRIRKRIVNLEQESRSSDLTEMRDLSIRTELEQTQAMLGCGPVRDSETREAIRKVFSMLLPKLHRLQEEIAEDG